MIKLFFDLETTGFSEKNDKVIEIAAQVLNEDTGKVLGTFQTFINPGVSIPARITEITGIDNKMVTDAPSEQLAFEDFAKFLKEHDYDMLAGHNINAFDMRWLHDRNARYKLKMNLEVPTLDTLVYVKEIAKTGKLVGYNFTTKTGRPSFRLECLMDYFELGTQDHRAINDVKNNIQIYLKLKKMEEDGSSLGF